MTAAPTWRNWSGTVTARPARVVAPATVEELSAVVRAAGADGLRVKAVGSGHSFTGVAATDGVLLRMAALDAPVQIDAGSGLVTVEAGMPLHRLNAVLAAHGLAMTNLGDIDRQTVSGAISTGTHGTGARSGGLAAQVRGLELVCADGSRLRCSAAEEPEVFAAARVGLGALGVLTSVTLQCEPAFHLRAQEGPMGLTEVLGELPRLLAENEHVEFYWFPHTDRTLTKRNNRLPAGEPPRPPRRARAWFDDEFLSNTLYEGVNRLATAVPRAIPRLNALSSRALAARTYSHDSYRVFTSPRRVVFREMEYAVPREAVAEVLLAIRRWVADSGERVAFPVEVRFAPADDVWLSTAYRRESAYVAVHQYHRLPYERYFRAVAEIADAVGGRPHWGKLHWLDAAALRERYPRFADFLAVRERLDPDGVFANPYLDRVLGPVPSRG
ncbi:D-arabinono-1,4-lactone oxidase [Streptomyces sp. DSM 44915]|uniref:D-arabinono-1,4-lactone oxidase n=1 Tax=Streptomyces chisholmiae TaxID=3075540 RepID=A0ABU2JVX1_9ACTN|nr:D-arabinono-1,4-lactone oxidase [Streptomyces sp. DSM 44915]MDT0269090.1 D-arabinono-1,4-lactone oxidase [Streptomyces sp. DSM 44915]